jgi:hypothetical protein
MPKKIPKFIVQSSKLLKNGYECEDHRFIYAKSQFNRVKKAFRVLAIKWRFLDN